MKDIPENFDNLIAMLNSEDVRDARLALELIETHFRKNIMGNHKFKRIAKIKRKIANRLNISSVWDLRYADSAKWYVSNGFTVFHVDRTSIIVRRWRNNEN
jgi:hypothetical protein